MSYPRQFGYDSQFTQKIANNLPDWHVIRTDKTTTGFRLLNSYGITLGEMEDDIVANRRNLYLSTADTLVRWDAYRIPVPQQIELGNNSSKNFLLNSHFQDPGMVVKNQPREWEVSSVTRYTSKSYKGTSVSLSPEPGETSYLYQDFDGEIQAGDVITASVYAQDTGDYPSGDEAPYLALQISIYPNEGGIATQTSLHNLDDIEGWERFSVTLPVTMDSYKMRFTMRVVYPFEAPGESLIYDHISFFTHGGLGESSEVLNTLGAFSYGVFTDEATLTTTHTLLSAPQLEFGSEATEWKPSPADTIGHDLRMVIDFNEGNAPRWLELDQVFTPWELFEDAIPTRAETSLGITGDIVLYDSGPTYYEWSNESWDTSFRVTGDVVQLYNINVQHEVIMSWSIYDRFVNYFIDDDEEFDIPDDVTRTLEALTVYRKRLYIICKETWNDETKRILKVLDWGGLEDRLQVVRDVDIGYAEGTVSSIGFIEGHIDKLGLIFDDDSSATVQLYFDYFYYDRNARQLLTRHPYSDGSLRIIEV